MSECVANWAVGLQDEHIHELETELESTGQDKVTITQLAAENAQLRENLKESEEREEEVRTAVDSRLVEC